MSSNQHYNSSSYCGCSGAPLEEHLAQSSLWPEIAKLYGHGAELFCLAASPSGDLVASACKAQTSTTAAIWLWDTKRWTAIGSLTAHGLTITQLQFSPNGQRLLSVSRDRTFAVYDRVPGELPQDWSRHLVAVSSKCGWVLSGRTLFTARLLPICCLST